MEWIGRDLMFGKNAIPQSSRVEFHRSGNHGNHEQSEYYSRAHSRVMAARCNSLFDVSGRRGLCYRSCCRLPDGWYSRIAICVSYFCNKTVTLARNRLHKARTLGVFP